MMSVVWIGVFVVVFRRRRVRDDVRDVGGVRGGVDDGVRSGGVEDGECVDGVIYWGGGEFCCCGECVGDDIEYYGGGVGGG